MKFVIHIGYPKTGTTALEKFLTLTREKIFKEKRIYYPISGGSMGEVKELSHYPLAFYISPKIVGGNMKVYEMLFQQLKEEIGNLKDVDTVLLSSEHFIARLHPKNFSRFLFDISEHFKPDEILIVLYIRRQDLAVESAYKQAVVDNTVRESQDINDLIEQFTIRFNYYATITKLKEIAESIKNARVIPLIYDRKKMVNGNIISDFFKNIFNIDIDVKLEARKSLSAESAVALRKINEEYELPQEIHQDIVGILSRIDELNESKTFLLSTNQRKQILEMLEDSNRKLFKEIFGTNKNEFSIDNSEEYKMYDTGKAEKIFDILVGILTMYSSRLGIKIPKRIYTINPFQWYKKFIGAVTEGYGWIANLENKTPEILEVSGYGEIEPVKIANNHEEIKEELKEYWDIDLSPIVFKVDKPALFIEKTTGKAIMKF